jgi:hypothetical protein
MQLIQQAASLGYSPEQVMAILMKGQGGGQAGGPPQGMPSPMMPPEMM